MCHDHFDAINTLAVQNFFLHSAFFWPIFFQLPHIYIADTPPVCLQVQVTSANTEARYGSHRQTLTVVTVIHSICLIPDEEIPSTAMTIAA